MSTESFFNQTNITNFIFDVPDGKLTKAFQLNVQTATLPGVSIPVTNVPAQAQGISTGSAPGSGIEFTPIEIEFIVDEYFKSWLQMYEWMLSTNNYIDRSQSGWTNNDKPRICMLHVLDNAKKDVVMTIKLSHAWCSELDPISFDYGAGKDPAIKCKATIHYMKMAVDVNGVEIKGRVNAAEKLSREHDNIRAVHPSQRNI